ncbi:MAG TPA: WD40 repeat domain-containing protein, partial [Anaerolineales bacterium]|nr:WD40 repeat domain-containing protein [Anaerolineales bacterium]
SVIMQASCNLDVTLEFSNNNKYLIVSDNKKATWVKTKKRLRVFNLEKETPSLLWENESFLETKNDLSENQNQICLSRSEKLIASCVSEGEVCVWNALSGELLIRETFKKELSQFQKDLGLSDSKNIQYFYFLPTNDDNLLVKAEKDIWVIETKTGTRRNITTGTGTDFLQLDGFFTISHNANYLAYIKGEVVFIWNLKTNLKIDQTLTHAIKANCIHFSIDETIIISGGEDGLINILDLRATS